MNDRERRAVERLAHARPLKHVLNVYNPAYKDLMGYMGEDARFIAHAELQAVKRLSEQTAIEAN